MTLNTNGTAIDISIKIMQHSDIMNYVQSTHTILIYDINRDLKKAVSMI